MMLNREMLNGKIYNCRSYIYVNYDEAQLLNNMMDLYSPTLHLHLYQSHSSQNRIDM